MPAQVFNLIRKIGNLAQERGFSAYIVGGFVRDFLLGIGNLDLDIVLETDALDFVKILKDKFKLNVVTHRRFGTATVTMPSGFKIDIASAREEYYPYASALPAITYSSIKEDLFRRDFTINALAIKINRDNFGQLLDLFDGLKDLTEGKIRVLHGKSFIDDPTRILRAIRFEQRYNFTIEENTARLIEQAKRKGMLRKLSRFRVGDELILILKEEDPLKSLKRIYRLCGLGFIHPLIKIDKMVSRQFESIKREVILFRRNHAGRSLENWLIYFMILTFRLSLPQIKRLCRDFCLTRRDVRKIDLFKRNATRTIKLIDKDKSMPAHRVYEILSHFSDEAILLFFAWLKPGGPE